jgi:hypothetical protein
MAFYASLLICCLVLAAMIVWAFRALSDASHNTLKYFLPGSGAKRRAAGNSGVAYKRRNASGQLTPWGWGGSSDKNQSAATSQSVPAYTQREQVGWPYRDEPFGISEKSLGETRPGTKIVGVRKIVRGGVGKPWGW